MATYLITGASSGLGAEMARQLCRAGDTVYGVARSADKLLALKSELGDRFDYWLCDVTDKEAVGTVCANLPTLPDVVILNAGVGFPETRTEFSADIHEKTFAVNYFGAIYFIHHLLKPMQHRGYGKFVAVASLAGYLGLPLAAAYC